MAKVKLVVTESRCRSGLCKKGDTFLIGDLCPPLCHELWHAAYPFVYALLNGALLDYGEDNAAAFDLRCPDGGRVVIHGERLEQDG